MATSAQNKTSLPPVVLRLKPASQSLKIRVAAAMFEGVSRATKNHSGGLSTLTERRNSEFVNNAFCFLAM